MGRKEAVRLEIFFIRGMRTLGTVHIDLTLSLLIIQLISTREPRRERSQDARNGRGGGAHAVISCHGIVTAERLWQLWHSGITGQDFNTRRSGEEGGKAPARGPPRRVHRGRNKGNYTNWWCWWKGDMHSRLCNCTLHRSIKSWPGKWVRH